MIDQAKLIAIGTYNAVPTLQSPLLTNDNYHNYFPQAQSSSTIPSSSLEAIAKEYNVKQPEQTQHFSRLKRGSKELPPKQTTNQPESSQPIHQVHHKHNKLTEFEKNEFISLVHRLHLDVYNAVITYMAIASSIVNTEAAVNTSRKRRHQDDEEYFEDKYRKYGNRFASSDDVDYLRDRHYHGKRDYHSNDDWNNDDNHNDNEDNKKKRKVKSRGTAISDRNNNNNPNLENNNNNNNNNNVRNNEEEDTEEEENEEKDK